MSDLKYFPLSLLDESMLSPLMLEEEKAWESDLRWDYSAVREILLSFARQKLLPGYAAVDENRAVGYTYFLINHAKGIIGSLFVSDKNNSAETVDQLIQMATAGLKDATAIKRVEAQIMPFNNIDLTDSFIRQGYSCYPRTYLELNLDDSRTGNEVPPMGRIIPWNTSYLASAADMNMLSYRNQIDAEICEDYRTKPGCESYLRSLVEYPGCGVFMPEASFMAIDAQGSICGLVICSRISNGAAMIPQIAVHPNYQGSGLGNNLVNRTFIQLKSTGFSSVSLTVTLKNYRAFEWYKRLGFKEVKDFAAFVWER
jgi:ribosomal protein S18 acetylase RimI-like enzyme